jgi:hypothetical protein
VIVCIDANFAHTCLESSSHDPPMTHPQSFFLKDEDVSEMQEIVEKSRESKSNNESRSKGNGSRNEPNMMQVPDHVLEQCEKSYSAAQETGRTSKVLYRDTGLMAMLCRHDRVLWLVNMTTAGEKQYYAFALLRQLMQSLPDDWTVGLMYDIACQIERSMVKVSLQASFQYVELSISFESTAF